MRKLTVFTVAVTLTASGAAFGGPRHVASDARASAWAAESLAARSEALGAEAKERLQFRRELAQKPGARASERALAADKLDTAKTKFANE